MAYFLELFQIAAGNIFLYVVVLLLSLSFVIFVHELGHYLTARFFRVRIDKFSLGFGREVLGRTDRRGTRWSLSLIPLGGYVKIFGDTDPLNPQIWDEKLKARRPLTPEEYSVAFCSKPVWQRALIVAAGPAINFILAFFIMAALFAAAGQVSTRPVVTAIGEGTAAYEQGFRVGDVITAIEGKPVRRFEDVWEYTYDYPGIPYEFTLRRGDETVILKAASQPIEYTDLKGIRRAHGRLGATHIHAVKLEEIMSVDGIKTGGDPERARALLTERFGRDIRLGLSYGSEEDVFLTRARRAMNPDFHNPESEDHALLFTGVSMDKLYVTHNPVDSIKYTFIQIKKSLGEALNILGLVLRGGAKQESLGGIGSMSQTASKAAESGWYTFLIFISILSIQIGFVNLFPIPVLDGGYLVFLACEAVRGKPLSERVQDYAFSFGLVILFGIMIFANINDIFQLAR